MKRELTGSMVFDTSALLEMLFSTPYRVKAREALKSHSLSLRVCDITMAEAEYVLCKRLGEDEAHDRITNLLKSGYVDVYPDSELIEDAAEYKCKRSLSLLNCFSLALAKRKGTPVVFARREKELEDEMSKKPFDVDILFLEEF
ncbi:MAG: PIN domain-containing protein [Conexivisphaerales archaeon]